MFEIVQLILMRCITELGHKPIICANIIFTRTRRKYIYSFFLRVKVAYFNIVKT